MYRFPPRLDKHEIPVYSAPLRPAVPTDAPPLLLPAPPVPPVPWLRTVSVTWAEMSPTIVTLGPPAPPPPPTTRAAGAAIASAAAQGAEIDGRSTGAATALAAAAATAARASVSGIDLRAVDHGTARVDQEDPERPAATLAAGAAPPPAPFWAVGAR